MFGKRIKRDAIIFGSPTNRSVENASQWLTAQEGVSPIQNVVQT